MTIESNSLMPMNKTVALIALLTIISGSLVLFGWVFDITVLKSILPMWVSMKANTAFCFILIGIMLLSLPSVFAVKFSILLSCIGWFCGLLAGLIGVLTLSEYLFDWNIGIDQWLIHESAGTVGTVYAGRMAPETAWCFVLLAIAAWFNTVRSHIVAASLGLLVLILSLMATLLNVTSAFNIFGIAFGFTQMAFHTAMLFMLLGYAVITMNWRCYDDNTPSTSFSRSRLILVTSMIAVIPVVITMALLVLFQLRENTENKIAVFTQNIAEIIELSTEGLLDKIANSLLASADEITRQFTAKSIDLPAITLHLAQQKSRLPEVNYLQSSNEHGDLVYGLNTASPPINIADRDYFITLRDTHNANLIVITPLVSRVSHQWVWLIACRVNKPDGSFAGIVHASIVLDKISWLLSRIQLNSDDFIALYDTDLRLITSYPSPSNIQVPIGDNNQLSPLFTAALKSNPNVGTYVATSIDAISRTHSYRRNPKYDFIINVGVANKAALAEWRKQVWIITTLVSFFIIALLAFSRLIKQSWLRQEHDMELLKINQQALYDAQRLAKLGNYHYDISRDLWTSSAILDDIFGSPYKTMQVVFINELPE